MTRPIPLPGYAVKALAEGRLRQVRVRLRVRIADAWPSQYGSRQRWAWLDKFDRYIEDVRLPFKVGDSLWVQETWTLETDRDVGPYPPPHNDGRPIKWIDCPEYGRHWEQPWYKATDPTPDLAYPDTDEPACRWRSPVAMPRWASRWTLVVENVKVERVQDVTPASAIAEGFIAYANSQTIDCDTPNPRDDCRAAWIARHGPGSWERNDWCAVARVRVERP